MYTCRKRRSSSKLASLPTQQLAQEEPHEHASEEESGDEDDLGIAREGKRQRSEPFSLSRFERAGQLLGELIPAHQSRPRRTS